MFISLIFSGLPSAIICPQFTPPLIDNHVLLRKSKGFDKTREGSKEHGYHESLIAIKPSEVLEGLDRLNK